MALLPGLPGGASWEELLFRLAHTLAGSCAMLGAVEMQRAAPQVLPEAAAGARRCSRNRGAGWPMLRRSPGVSALRKAIGPARGDFQGWERVFFYLVHHHVAAGAVAEEADRDLRSLDLSLNLTASSALATGRRSKSRMMSLMASPALAEALSGIDLGDDGAFDVRGAAAARARRMVMSATVDAVEHALVGRCPWSVIPCPLAAGQRLARLFAQLDLGPCWILPLRR